LCEPGGSAYEAQYLVVDGGRDDGGDVVISATPALAQEWFPWSFDTSNWYPSSY